METIYSGQMSKYIGNDFGGLAIIDNDFYIEDKKICRINRQYSEKKSKYYAKLPYKNNYARYDFVVFKNGYVMILKQEISKPKEGDLSF